MGNGKGDIAQCDKGNTLRDHYRELVTNHIQGWYEAVNHDYRCKYINNNVKLDWQTI